MPRVNLLTSEVRDSANVRRSAGAWSTAGRAAALLLVAGYALFLLAAYASGLELERHRAALALLEPEVQAVLELRAERERAESRLQAWREAANHGGEWADLLGQVTGVLPADIWLTSLHLVPGEEEPKPEPAASPPAVHHPLVPGEEERNPGENPDGGAGGGGGAGEEPPVAVVVRIEGAAGTLASVGRFLHGLQRRPCFSGAELQSVREGKDGVLVFAVDVRLAGNSRVAAFE
jgi:Tfp pilus assembly protein PilN